MAERDQDDPDSETDALENEQEGGYGEDGVRRPMNAFFIFCKRHRDVVREKYPHLENRSITKILGEWWANLDSSEKSSYTALAKQYKEAFMKAHPDFKWYKLPTAPARTLVTRPSNSRCLQGKKDKSISKSSSCGIALGKLADDKELGGLSSLISPCATDVPLPSADTNNHDTAISTVCAPTSSSTSISSNLLKPPKKRYLVNGEFKCQSEPLKYDSRDYQTQNACSALLELAEICVNSSGKSLSSAMSSSTSSENMLFRNIFSDPKISEYRPYPTLNCNNVPRSPTRCDSQTCRTNASSSSATYLKPSTSVCSSEFLPRNPAPSLPEIQDQPLNLCKEKEKTFTASNQELINHLVDKFLCDTPSPQNRPASEPPVPPNSNQPGFGKGKPVRQGFTLSAAIESAIDQAYSRSSPKSPAFPSSDTKKIKEDSNESTEVVFIDKIKKACLASCRKLPEKPMTSLYTLPSTSKEPEQKPSLVKEEATEPSKSEETLTKTIILQSDLSDPSQSTNSNLKRPSEFKFSSSKYYSKFVSPPKKSRVWCNLFMKEQLGNDMDNSTDGKSALLFDLSSPVRRNSQRTCKGRRYQALITEGLLQSTKERKTSTGKKLLPSNEKCKTKTSPTSQSPPPLHKSKRKKRDMFCKAKITAKEDSDLDKSEFDLNEKIASLPKCSFEKLNKKRKVSLEAAGDSKSSSNSGSKLSKKCAREVNVEVEDIAADASEESVTSSVTSSGRYKTGGFDLEQHIASLPKCDIEVLNKRKNKKE